MPTLINKAERTLCFPTRVSASDGVRAPKPYTPEEHSAGLMKTFALEPGASREVPEWYLDALAEEKGTFALLEAGLIEVRPDAETAAAPRRARKSRDADETKSEG